LYDPHAPYNPPGEFRARSRTPYDGEIAYADAQLGRLLESLRARGEIDRTLIVVAGDHGEGLGDHGERTHGMLLYDSTLRVPLVVKAPGVAPTRRDEAVSLVDIAPTILRAVGLAQPAEMKGRDLLQVRLKPDTTYGVRAMATRIGASRAAAGPAAAQPISPDAAQRLRALGYVASSPSTAAGEAAPNPASMIADWNAFETALTMLNRGERGAVADLQRL